MLTFWDVVRAEPFANCAACPLGRAAGERCPFVERLRAPGESLYLEGEPADRIWFVKRGVVVLTREAGEHRGEGVAWTVRGPGALIGAEALVRRTYLDSARMATAGAACGIARSELDGWLGHRTGAARTLLDLVLYAGCADGPRPTRCDGTAVERVARWLLDAPPHSAAGCVPRHILAELLGMTPETLSRVLARLAACGAIELSRRRLVVRDVAALAAAAGGESD